MKHYISLSKFPGTTGTYFYNNYFQYYDYPAVYAAHSCVDISEIELLHDNVHGISISMPFKQDVLKYVDFIDSTALYYHSANTIVRENNSLVAYNCDFNGVEHTSKYIEKDMRVSILGNGSMANMYFRYLNDYQYDVTKYARNLNNWDQRHYDTDVIINCTGLGTIVPYSPYETLPKCSVVIDLALKDNVLSTQCKNVKYVPGIEFYKHQFLAQFKLYTGIDPDTEYFDYLLKHK